MKKKLFGGLAVLAVAVAAAWNVNFSSQANEMSEVALKNVEALASKDIVVAAFYCSGTPVPLVCVRTADGKAYDAGEKVWL